MASLGLLNFVLLFGSVLVLAGILSSLVAKRFGAPLLLVFIVIGMLAGEDGPGGIKFDDYATTYLVGSLALAIILFDGGLRTKLVTVRGALTPSVVLATAGVVVTATLTGAFALLVLDLTLVESLLLGSIVASTDAAAVFFLLRSGGLELRQRVTSTIEVESSTNDPVAVFLTFLLVEILTIGKGEADIRVFAELARAFLIGGLVGYLGGRAIVWMTNRADLPHGLHPIFVVVSAVAIFSVTSVIHGSGFLAVYLAGLVVGNRPVRAFASVLSFHDGATWLCQIMMFMVLGLLVTPHQLINYAVPGIAIAAFLMLVGRPVAAAVCLSPFGYSKREILFVGWVGLRGAVSIFLASIPVLAGVSNAGLFFNVGFFVVLISLVVQGWTIKPAALWLRLALPRTTPESKRIEIDLPGQLKQELVGYPVQADSAVLAQGRVPDWAKPVLVIREGQILEPAEAGRLVEEDYAYFLVPLRKVQRLDQLFTPSTEAERDREAGEFLLEGAAQLGQVCALYGIPLPEGERADETIAEYFSNRFEDHPQIGDHLPFGPASLVARRTENGKVTLAGFLVDEDEEPQRPSLFRLWSTLVRRKLRSK
ncbi:MAG: potassium/proton antiporter [Alphaproteobacteria bacterium]|nr:potassium/proton antiporter [Alphaproteobacteria bacterium]